MIATITTSSHLHLHIPQTNRREAACARVLWASSVCIPCVLAICVFNTTTGRWLESKSEMKWCSPGRALRGSEQILRFLGVSADSVVLPWTLMTDERVEFAITPMRAENQTVVVVVWVGWGVWCVVGFEVA